MPSLRDLIEVPRRDLCVFYVLDTSSSMAGRKIATLNETMKETIDALEEFAHKNADANLKIAVMEYNSQCHWMTPNGPENLERDFFYEHLVAGGRAQVGAALRELNSKLSRTGWMQSMTGMLMPVIIFMTDGYATDDYLPALEEIRNNRWFKKGIKIGFALGDDADLSMIASIVGNSEAVIRTTDMDTFRRIFKYVVITVSSQGSYTSTLDTAVTGRDVVNRAKIYMGNDDNISVNLPDSAYLKEMDSSASDDNDWDDWNIDNWSTDDWDDDEW